MFLAWRTQLREAQQACNLGRLDEAAQRLSDHDLRKYKPGEAFARQLATAYLARARRRADEGNFAGAWHDLEQARQLHADEAWHEAQVSVACAALASVEPALIAGDFAEARRRLSQLERQPLSSDAIRTSEEVLRRAESAANLARRGKLVEAEELLASAAALRPEWPSLAQRLAALRAQQVEIRDQSEALHRAMLAEDWNAALALADRLLAIAPDLKLARDARRKAWAQVGAKMNDSRPYADTQCWPHLSSRTEPVAGSHATSAGTRFLLWVDGVGGFLVCLADEIWLGQAAAGSPIAVPIQAELSRRHARILRSGDGYILDAVHAVQIDGQPLEGKRLLADGDEMELGRGVRLRFRQPHPLSATARLELLSRHKTQPRSDGILLMAESCVLGPNWQNHVVCRDWSNDVVLYRQGQEVFCRSPDGLTIDGVVHESRGPLRPNSHVVGADFSFAVELI